MVTKYQKRISGPMLDRMDIHIEVPRVDYDKLSSDRLGESSARAYHRILKLSRTIADLAGSEKISLCIWQRRYTCGRPKLSMMG